MGKLGVGVYGAEGRVLSALYLHGGAASLVACCVARRACDFAYFGKHDGRGGMEMAASLRGTEVYITRALCLRATPRVFHRGHVLHCELRCC